jgi:hypothetical protein
VALGGFYDENGFGAPGDLDGGRAEGELPRSGRDPLVTLGLVEIAYGPAHGPEGTYYTTAFGCLVAVGREKTPEVTCPDCDGVGKIDGCRGRCVMCSGHGTFSADKLRALSG